ncbi:glycoside hydrolase family 3 C-terminal domain-containing protein [Pedobacter arcticus]|uniref:glycoside hydrolase family 3 C-terminal domain-containing protein n=1 Tax=Pedobacter arcticus TaxID=752140 RepID=UPI0002F83520|nr:glycoside hydrolase family 3 C-terminal domain-containing protein [Pedobacter arcticus]
MNFFKISWAILLCIAISTSSFAQINTSTEKKIDSLISLMTLQEKIGMIHASGAFTSGGVKRLGIPELVMSDGPSGVRREIGNFWEYYRKPRPGYLDSSTYLPVGMCLAATWNPILGYAYGKVLGSEANFRGKDVILGPSVNIIRTPLNGRNFEYQSEDPYLSGKISVEYIKGVQDQGVSASVKHFAANNQEVDRRTINVEMSERALREIYLPAFKAAVVEGNVNTVMGAYNKLRGQHASHNEYLNNKILKGEWGFKGLVMSDWEAANNTLEALLYGLDIEMGVEIDLGTDPTKYNKYVLADTSVVPLVKSGKVPESVIDDKVRRILRVMYKTRVIEGNRPQGAYNTLEHQQIALKVAEEGIVLLKNTNNILPLNKSKIKSIAVIGANADRKNALGGGSSQVKAFYEITPLQGIKTIAKDKIAINFTEGYRIERTPTANTDSLIKEAVKLASSADVAIVFGGWTNKNTDTDRLFLDAETNDKPNMDMPFGQDKLIAAVLKANPKTIIVLLGGGAIDITQWEEKASGIIESWYSGMEGGNALAKIIFGEVNPSGKLPVTFPRKLEDSPAHKLGEYPGNGNTVHYKDDIYVGYRYFDTYKVKPQFAFGHGLSYTTFRYNNIKTRKIAPDKVEVTMSITNTGKIAGAEVVQLYIKDEKSSLPRPYKELKSFQKVFLKDGESKHLTFLLNSDAFSYYDDRNGKWVVEPGIFELLIGSASDDIRLKHKFSL